jgi:hypothetical protein
MADLHLSSYNFNVTFEALEFQFGLFRSGGDERMKVLSCSSADVKLE